MAQEIISSEETKIQCGYCGAVEKNGIILSAIGEIVWPQAPQIHGKNCHVLVPMCVRCITHIADEVERLKNKDLIIIARKKLN